MEYHRRAHRKLGGGGGGDALQRLRVRLLRHDVAAEARAGRQPRPPLFLGKAALLLGGNEQPAGSPARQAEEAFGGGGRQGLQSGLQSSERGGEFGCGWERTRRRARPGERRPRRHTRTVAAAAAQGGGAGHRSSPRRAAAQTPRAATDWPPRRAGSLRAGPPSCELRATHLLSDAWSAWAGLCRAPRVCGTQTRLERLLAPPAGVTFVTVVTVVTGGAAHAAAARAPPRPT